MQILQALYACVLYSVSFQLYILTLWRTEIAYINGSDQFNCFYFKLDLH